MLAQVKEPTLTVKVSDQLENPIRDAQIAITDSAGRKKKIRTGESGEAKLTAVKAGAVEITITSKGFIEYRNASFILKPDEAAKLTITLEINPIESQVEVTSDDSVQADDYGMVTILTEEDIQKLPDDPAEFLKALRRIAGESITGDDLPVRVDDITGEAVPPKQLIEQIRIDRNAFSAKYAGMGGGGIQIYTSSSVRSFRGSADFGFADSRLTWADPFFGRRVPFQARSYRLNLAGPLGRKASFILSAGRSAQNSSAVVNPSCSIAVCSRSNTAVPLIARL